MIVECQRAILSNVGKFNSLTIERHAFITSFLMQRYVTRIRRTKATNVDVLDSFVIGLCEKKAIKWEKNCPKRDIKINTNDIQFQKNPDPVQTQYQSLLRKVNSLSSLENILDVRTLAKGELDTLILNALDSDDVTTFKTILDECFKHKITPSTVVVLRTLKILCLRDYDKSMALTAKIIHLCEFKNSNLYEQHAELHPFRAQCLWNAGKFTEALTFLKGIHGHPEPKVRHNIGVNYRKIVDDTILHRSEALLVSVTSHADDILVSFNDATVLEFIWEKCFLSEWFSDQQLAAQLFATYERLREITNSKTSVLVFSLLHVHNLDTVYRLIEQFLAFDLKNQCRVCLELLFDYQYQRGDLRACSEIMRNSTELNISLSDVYGQKLIDLLLRGPRTGVKEAVVKEAPKFEFKF